MTFHALLFACLLAAEASGMAAPVNVEGAAGDDTLRKFTIVSKGFRLQAPRTEADQEGFEQVKVAGQRRTIVSGGLRVGYPSCKARNDMRIGWKLGSMARPSA